MDKLLKFPEHGYRRRQLAREAYELCEKAKRWEGEDRQLYLYAAIGKLYSALDEMSKAGK